MLSKLGWADTNSVVLTHVTLATGAGLLAVGIAGETATSMVYVGGTFVASGLVIGPAAPLGSVAGLVIHDLFRGTVGYSTVAIAAWILMFAGLVAWLTGQKFVISGRRNLQSVHRTTPSDIGMVMIAGMYATAFTAWLVMMPGWQHFYTTAAGFLPGIVVAMGVCVAVLIAVDAVRRLNHLPDRNDIRNYTTSESTVLGRHRSSRHTGAAAVGVFIIGAGWLGGALALDVFVQDLGLFATSSQFKAFVTEFLGTSSMIAVAGTTLLVTVYRYGELAVLLSGPVAILALWGWVTYHNRILTPLFRRINTMGGESDR